MATTTDEEAPRKLTLWATVKSWLMIALVIIAVLLLFLMLFYGAVFNPDCSMTQMVLLECFRWG